MAVSDPLDDLSDFWLHASIDRLERRAAVPERFNRDLLQAVLVVARELRALRELVLQGQGGADRSGGGER